MEVFYVRDAAEDVIALLIPAANEKRIKIGLRLCQEMNSVVRSDRSRITQVLLSMLQSAIDNAWADSIVEVRF